MKNLQLKYSLDYPEMSDRPTGNIMLVVIDINDNNHVHAVQTVSCDLKVLRDTMTALYEGLGDIFVPANDTSLFDYEFVHAEMDKELTEVLAQRAAEDAAIQNEKDLKTAKRVLEMLSTQSFDDFYNGKHMLYIEGGDDAPTEEEMLDLVANKFVKRF